MRARRDSSAASRAPPQSSGVPIDPACFTTYHELQAQHKLRWVIFGIEDNCIKTIAHADMSKKGRDAWAEFTAPENMPDGTCRYGVFDLDIAIDDGVHERESSKIVFLNWADDNAKIKVKMVHASSKDAFRKGLTGVAVDYQVRARAPPMRSTAARVSARTPR